MSLLMGALGGLGKGMAEVGELYGKKALIEAEALQKENLLRLGITLGEESKLRTEKELYDRTVSRAPAELARKVTETETIGDVNIGLEEKKKKTLFPLELDQAKQTKQAEIDIQIANIPRISAADTKAKKLAIADLNSSLGLAPSEQRRVAAAMATGLDVLKPVEMKNGDKISANKMLETYMSALNTSREEVVAEQSEKGSWPWGDKKLSKDEIEKEVVRRARNTTQSVITMIQGGAGAGGGGASIDSILSDITTVDGALKRSIASGTTTQTLKETAKKEFESGVINEPTYKLISNRITSLEDLGFKPKENKSPDKASTKQIPTKVDTPEIGSVYLKAGFTPGNMPADKLARGTKSFMDTAFKDTGNRNKGF